ncbi:hypothetical protein [Bartonella jaculi]|uniref:hypothetical protein n=1 Tax=Bartonella jaculi TaxID=686226 RepID=UPI0031ECA3EA
MNMKSHTTKQVRDDKPSFFVVEQKEEVNAPSEVTMSDIAKKLRSVYTQMQMKHSPRYLTPHSPVEENFKSYLDDISRAILAEHYIRRQKEKKLFECLEQIKTLVQSLQSEKKNPEAAVTRRMSRSKSFDSVVQHLAHMVCEENQERSLLQEEAKFSGQKSVTPIQTNVENALQQRDKSSLLSDAMKSSSKEVEELVERSAIEEKPSDVQESRHCIENNHPPSLKAESHLKAENQGISFFLRYPVKKFLLCFLIIAFISVITLCFYDVLRGVRFF